MISFLVSLGVPPWRAELLQLGRRRLALLGGLTLVADDLIEPVTFLLLVGDLLRHELELDRQPTVRAHKLEVASPVAAPRVPIPHEIVIRELAPRRPLPAERLDRGDGLLRILEGVDRHATPEIVADDRGIVPALPHLLEEALVGLDPGAHELRAWNVSLYLAYNVTVGLHEVGSSSLELFDVVALLDDVPPLGSFGNG